MTLSRLYRRTIHEWQAWRTRRRLYRALPELRYFDAAEKKGAWEIDHIIPEALRPEADKQKKISRDPLDGIVRAHNAAIATGDQP